MDPYNTDPYASTPVRYPTTSYVTLTPSSHGSAVMQGAYDGQNGAGARSDGTPRDASGPRDAQAGEIPGAPAGNVRYRCMTLPVNDGDDIEDVIAQVGLDGVKCFAVGDETKARRAFELPRIAKWSMTDPTILTIHAKEGTGETSLALSADVKTIAALVDVLTTSAFQWCELNGLDAMDTIVSSGSDWMNLKATTVGSGATATSSAAGIRFWETPEYSGWLTKQGEMLRTWRKRWFVLKQGHLVWFKTNVVNERAVTRGEIPIESIDSVSVASEAAAGKPYAIHLEGALPARIGTKYLVADSERERSQWLEALQKAMRERTSTSTGQASTTEQLRQGFAQAATPPSASRPLAPERTPPHRFADPSNIQIEVQGYTSPAPPQQRDAMHSTQGTSYVTLPPLPFAHPSSAAGSAAFDAPTSAPGAQYYPDAYSAPPSDWMTAQTPEGKTYYYNAKTGETSWNAPRR